jgi:hypothetical protein
MAFLPLAGGVSAEPSSQTPMPVAIAQPLSAISPEMVPSDTPVLPESGLLILVGTALMGLASIVRRTTKN